MTHLPIDSPVDPPAPVLPDPETLLRLARQDPEALERLRLDLVARLIDGAPAELQARLRGLQFRIDQVRRLAHTPLNATLRISNLMWRSFMALNDELSGRGPRRDSGRSASVIVLPPESWRRLSGKR